jgi:hypothetical protein
MAGGDKRGAGGGGEVAKEELQAIVLAGESTRI